LSDDPSKLAEPDKTPQRTPGSHRGHGGRGGGMPPMGSPGPGTGDTGYRGGGTYIPVAYLRVAAGRSLKTPARLSIAQKDSSIVIRTNMSDGTQTVDEYTAGTKTTIPYGNDGTADRSVGWRGAVFVVAFKPKKGSPWENDFALDDEGHLIMTTATRGG